MTLALGALAVTAAPAEGAYPGANGRIVFVETAQGQGGFGWQAIVSMRPDGSGRRGLAGGDADTQLDFDPAWSPGGTRIAFVRSFARPSGIGYGTLGSEIYVMNADGKRKRRLTRNALADGAPTWSPDGKRIMFWRGRLRGRAPFADLWVMRADGTKQRRLAKTRGLEVNPAWGPRGRRIAFVVGQSLWTASPQARDRRLIAEDDRIGDPSWSPDGMRIAFTTRPGVVIANADGTGQRVLARNLRDPAWAPDGSALVAVGPANRLGDFWRIYVVALDGQATAITRDPAPPGSLIGVDHSQPEWQPLRRR